MTETNDDISLSPAGVTIGSAGLIFPASELKVVDLMTLEALGKQLFEEDRCKFDLRTFSGANRRGEICVKSGQIMKGYPN
jgi:long-subunit acyl-CoA synthetase (AMP-forming)